MKMIYSHRNRTVLKKRKVFVGFLPVGFPNEEQFLEIIGKLQSYHLDVFEIGYPPSNPYADGETIKSAYKAIDYSISQSLDYWKKIREKISTPIWIMGYSSDLIDSMKYLELSKAGVVDAFVIPDIDIEVNKRIRDEVKKYNVDLVYFVKNDCCNLKEGIEEFSILYYQLASGVTGTTEHSIHRLIENSLKNKNDDDEFYILGGFGIDSPNKVISVIESGFDGAIIGTEMLKRLNVSEGELYSFVNEVNCKLL